MGYFKTLWGYIRNYKFNSILLKHFILFLLLLILPMGGVSLMVYRYNHSIMEEEIGRANISALSRIRVTVDMIARETERLSIRLMSDPDIETFLTEEHSYPLEFNRINRIHRIQQILRTSSTTNEFIHSIYIYSNVSGRVVTSDFSGDVSQYPLEWWYRSYQENKPITDSWIVRLRSETQLTAANGEFIGYYRQTPLLGREKTGVILINIDANKLGQWLSGAEQEQEQQQQIYIVNGSGTILYSQDPSLLNTPFEESEGVLAALVDRGVRTQFVNRGGVQQAISVVDSGFNDWRYISAVPLETYHVKQTQLKRFIAVLTALGVGICIIVAFVITVQGFQPIRRIISLIENKTDNGYFPNKRNFGKLDEIKYIASNLMTSFDKHKEMEDELEERYRKLKKAQSIALQAQINPHFLFNTLEAINWEVIRLTSGKNTVSGMIRSLSELLRMSLETEDNVVTVGNELEHAKLYLEIQQIRYQDQFQVQWKIDEQVKGFKTIKLTLQPIVENAIYHGIKPSGRPGLIAISGFMRTDCMILRIKDNGVGIPWLEAVQLNADLKKNDIKEDRHIGLRNVNQRIRITFGDDYGVKIRSVAAKGTIVEIKLPIVP